MEKQIHNVGERVEKFCVPCNEQFGHVVKSVSKQGKISRVTCSVCGTSGTYKASAKILSVEELSTKTGSPYDQTKKYRQGQIISHPMFGVGAVTTVCSEKTMDVLFLDRVRRLVHSRV